MKSPFDGLNTGISSPFGVRLSSAAFSPQSLFANGEEGAWLEAVSGQVFTDTAGTTAAGLDDGIGNITALAGTVTEATQSDPNKRPLFKDPGADFDGTDDAIEVTIPAGGITGEMYYASSAGKGVFGVNFAAGTRTFGTLNWRNNLHALIFVDRSFTASEASGLDSRFDGVAGDFDTLVDGGRLFRDMGLTHIVEGYEWSSLEGASRMFGKNDLQEIPPGMRLPSLVNGRRMFRRNSNLAIVPSDFAADSDCTDWERAFEDTGLTQQSIDNILTNLAARGTSNGVFYQSGGSAPSATGEAAIDAMRGRGWTIFVTGGY